MRARQCVAILLGLACFAGEPAQDVSPPWAGRHRLQVIDEPDKLRLALVLTSADTRDICVSRAAWPDAAGTTQTGSEVYSLTTERETLHPRPPTIYADCFKGPECEIRLGPGESLKGFIAYSEFGDPQVIRSRARRLLKVDIIPALCDWEAAKKP